MCSTVGGGAVPWEYHDKCWGILSTMGDTQYRGGYYEYCGGYHPLSFEYRGGYHDRCLGYHEYCGVFSTVRVFK